MRRRNDVIVGVVIAASIAVIFFGTLWLKGGALGQERTVVYARFREIGQLMEGNSVKLRGVPIGRVDDIRLEPGSNGVVVAMRVDSDVELPPDAIVLLSPESLFGDWQAEIHPRSRYPHYTYAEAPDPQVLPGYSLPDISQLTAVADRIAANMAVLTDRVELAFTEETALNLRSVIENIQDVSEQLTGLIGRQERAMNEVADNLEQATVTLGEAAEVARRTFAQVEEAVADGQLREIVENVHRAANQLDSLTILLKSASITADSAFKAVNTIASQLEAGEGTVGRLLSDTTLYAELVSTNRQIQALLLDIQQNPRKYINLEIF